MNEGIQAWEMGRKIAYPPPTPAHSVHSALRQWWSSLHVTIALFLRFLELFRIVVFVVLETMRLCFYSTENFRSDVEMRKEQVKPLQLFTIRALIQQFRTFKEHSF